MNALLERITPITARLLETDMHMGRLDEAGIFATLDREGVLDHRIMSPADLDAALHEPPARGRARIRSACIKRLAGSPDDVQCRWDRVIDQTNGRWLDLRDPFQCEGGTWASLPQRGRPSETLPDPSLAPVARAIAAGVPGMALDYMRTRLANNPALSRPVCAYCIDLIEGIVPGVPVPVLPRGVRDPVEVLERLFERVTRFGDYPLEDKAGMLLYHCHLARGRHEQAGQITERLLARARAVGNVDHTRRNLNNLGFTHMLRGDWGAAEPHLRQAIGICEENGWRVGAAVSRANLLECRFNQLPPARWTELIPELKYANRILMRADDWRARKTLRLLSRLARHRRRQGAARAWARLAIDASEGVATQMREWDVAYLRELLDEEPDRVSRASSGAQLPLF